MIRRLNHAVLWVRDAQASAVFLRADGSTNDHDLGLFSVGDRQRPAPHSPGLYHLAWQVHTIDELVALRAKLVEAGSLMGESDHGVSKSLYAVDPDGIEFEVMWAVPQASWPTSPGIERLDLEAELARWSAVDTADQ
jgi:catechol-2,3-dioxygenase